MREVNQKGPFLRHLSGNRHPSSRRKLFIENSTFASSARLRLLPHLYLESARKEGATYGRSNDNYNYGGRYASYSYGNSRHQGVARRFQRRTTPPGRPGLRTKILARCG